MNTMPEANNGKTVIECDICILGAGSGGLSLASAGAQMGAKMVLLEPGKMGGDCLNTGCVPSKSLIHAAKAAESQRKGGPGVAGHRPEIDFNAAMDHVHATIKSIEPHDSQERFEGLGVNVIREAGRFRDMDTVETDSHIIKAGRYVVAVGSRPVAPPIKGLESVPYLTNETVWDFKALPEHLVVIGAGVIGVELAQAMRRLGAEVTLVDVADFMGREDPDVRDYVRPILGAEGVRILDKAELSGVAGTGTDLRVTVNGEDIKASHILVAAGRVANTDRIGAENGSIEVNRAGVVVGKDLRSSNKKVYAIGDAAGGAQFTHVAGAQAGTMVQALLLGLPAKFTSAIPYVIYTDPEVAHVGMKEAEARRQYGDKLRVERFAIGETDRGRTDAATGWLKVMLVGKKVVGATITGPHAGELITPWTLAVSGRVKLSHIAQMIMPYPTYSEVSKRLAGGVFAPALFGNPWVKRWVRFIQSWR